MSIKTGTVSVPRVKAFHQAFMNAIRTHGRVHEIELITRYKLKTMTVFEDLDLGKEMFTRGRIRLTPERIRGLKEVRKIVKID
jgi:hypothetical protein